LLERPEPEGGQPMGHVVMQLLLGLSLN
jgi:hypothetical protein